MHLPLCFFDKGHGRIETRRIWISAELVNYGDFPYQQQTFRSERITTNLNGNPLRREVAFGITRLSPEKAGTERLLVLNRGHWSIENGLHYVRDGAFDEDRSRIRTKTGPRIMATLRNLAIGILHLKNHGNIAGALRFYAAKPHLTLALIGM